MIEADEKSNAATARVHPEVILDGRLALCHPGQKWLAVADVHYGYEVSRRAAGGLYPLWGMDTIDERLASLIADYRPETVIIAGDIVDSGAVNREAMAWLDQLRERCRNLVLVAGNHDRGTVRRRVEFVDHLEVGGFHFHHGHLPLPGGSSEQNGKTKGAGIEICGHWHPAVSLHDGAGLSLRAPALVQETRADNSQRWILPAFSPWAGGGPWHTPPSSEVRTWVCSPGRVFEME